MSLRSLLAPNPREFLALVGFGLIEADNLTDCRQEQAYAPAKPNPTLSSSAPGVLSRRLYSFRSRSREFPLEYQTFSAHLGFP